MINSVTLLGSSSGRNAGDAALISGIMDAVDNECGKRLRYEIPSVRPSYITNNYANDAHPVGMMPWNLSVKMFGFPTWRSIMRTDLSLIFDAILFDRSLYNPLFNYLSTVYLMLPFAKRAGKILGMYNVGAGPVNTDAGKKMLREVSELMDFITVRDQDSYDILREIGVKNPRMTVAADAALTVTPPPAERIDAIISKAGFLKSDNILAINVNRYLDSWASPGRKPMTPEQFVSVYGQALSAVVQDLGVQLMFVSTQHHDVEISTQVMNAVQAPCRKALISNVDLNHYEIQGVMARAGLLFGMRLHSIILAASVHTPVIGLEYQPKVTHFLKTAGLGENSLSFNDFTVEQIAAHIKNAWLDRAKIRAVLDTNIPRLQEQARIPARLIAGLSRGESVDVPALEAVAAG
jgi:polysaccharide pyruvyl transferase WcaK-like protein